MSAIGADIRRLFDHLVNAYSKITKSSFNRGSHGSNSRENASCGLEEKDVQTNLADDVLTIKGEKKAEKEEKDKNYRLVERSYGSFSRSIQLP